MAEVNEMLRRMEAEMPNDPLNPSPAREARTREIEGVFNQLGSHSDHEARADEKAAYAAGRLGFPLDNYHVAHVHSTSERYPHAKMAAANIEGYLRGLTERWTGGRRALNARERAYLDGVRFMLEGSARYEEPLPYGREEAPGRIAERIRWSAMRIAQRLFQGPRPWFVAPERAGRMDAFYNLPPRAP
jgi:hypothetical protein